MFEFASAVITVWEKKLFNREDQERMLKAPDKERAFAVLFDTDLGDIAVKEKEIEKILEQDLADFKIALAKILNAEEPIFSFLFLKFDSLNLKIALKKILKAGEIAISPFSQGLVSYEKIEQKSASLLTDKMGSKEKGRGVRVEINPFVEKMMERAVEEIKTTPLQEIASRKIETAVDKAYLETRLEIAQKIDGFLSEIVKLEIDISNIKSLLKADNHNLDFIGGGGLEKEGVAKLIALKEGEIFQDLKKFLEVFNLSLLMERFAKERSETALENKLQGFLTEQILAKEKEAGTGPEKILAFFHKKLNGYSNIRLILFAKENNLSPEAIEKNLLPV